MRGVDGSTTVEQEILAAVVAASTPHAETRLIRQLRNVGTVASIPMLRLLATDARDPGVRVAAVRAVTAIGGQSAIDALIQVVATTRDDVTLFWAARGLGQQKAWGAVPTLTDRLATHGVAGTRLARTALVKALWAVPHRTATPVLARHLADDDRTTRRLAAAALARIGTPEADSALRQAAETMPWWRGRFARRALSFREKRLAAADQHVETDEADP